MKFEEAFSTFDDRCHSIDEICMLYNCDMQNFQKNYKGTFYCPLCRQALLSYNNAVTPYFKSYPDSKHAEDCELRQDEMHPSAAQKFVDDPDNNAMIQRQMQSILSSLFKEEKETTTKKPNMQNVVTGGISYTTSAPQVTKRLGRKHFDLPLRAEDFDCVKYFFGTAHLVWEKAENKGRNYYKILLYHIKERKLLCRILITEKVYEYMMPDYKYPEEYDCKLVFVSKAEEKSGKNYFQTYLSTSKHIQISKI